MAVPSSYGSSALPPCARIDMLKEYAGIDVQKMYPPAGVKPDQELRDNWTWETFLTAAAKCNEKGHPFGIGLSTCTAALNMACAGFAAHRSFLGDEKGGGTGQAQPPRPAVAWFQRSVEHLAHRRLRD